MLEMLRSDAIRIDEFREMGHNTNEPKIRTQREGGMVHFFSLLVSYIFNGKAV